ncbi:PIN domain-containing protein [Acidovorax sp. BLS4]|uniref:PIN domain-containing protein n=1 Tax=Acidovorax sp. BLS4 TaxID=3273430 RepID=UPI002942C659|nr:PIN domain-containing protein [Paracidovorax avenae]WOI47027.1 PIN domain-containing protein [Paracidovorax avenae]
MIYVLIDTCVWLKLAEDHKHTPLLQVVRGAVALGKMKLVVPRQVADEFARNRARTLKSADKSFAGHLQEVRKAIAKVGGDKKKNQMVLAHLAEVNHKLPQLGRPVESTLDEIEKLLSAATIVDPSDAVMRKAAERALRLEAPCHRSNKNSIADAVIFETYAEVSRAGRARDRFAFVTDNHNDFSVPDGDFKLPHPDIAKHFSKIKSMYFVNLAECLRRVDPSFVSEVQGLALQEKPRGISELLKEHEILRDKLWYGHHKHLEWQIEKGKVKLVTKAEWDALMAKDHRSHSKHVVESGIKLGRAAAKRMEKKYGSENLGPWSAFEWGMMNGKLSALRWMMGEEWDMLDL